MSIQRLRILADHASVYRKDKSMLAGAYLMINRKGKISARNQVKFEKFFATLGGLFKAISNMIFYFYVWTMAPIRDFNLASSYEKLKL